MDKQNYSNNTVKIDSLDDNRIDIDQSAFVFFENFSILFYTRKNNEIHFLLRKSPKTQNYKLFGGKIHRYEDGAIIQSACRKIFKKTSGLFSSTNIYHFLESNINPELSCVTLCNPDESIAERINNEIWKQYEKLLTDTNYIYQIPRDKRMIYFLEIPELNICRVNEYCKLNNIPYEFKQESFANIQNDRTLNLYNTFNCSTFVTFYKKYILNNEPIQFHSSYAILYASPRSMYSLMSIYCSHFKKFGEKWDFFKVIEKEVPNDEQLKNYKGVIVPGSPVSVYNEKLEWTSILFEVCRKIYIDYKNINYLGICFGAQAFTQANNGLVEKMNCPFISGAESLITSQDFFSLPYVKDLKLTKKDLVVVQAHGDHIVRLPEGAKIQSSSKSTNVEIFTIENRVLGFQGHPDYNAALQAVVFYKIRNATKPFNEFYEDILKEFYSIDINQPDTLGICYNFLKQNKNEDFEQFKNQKKEIAKNLRNKSI